MLFVTRADHTQIPDAESPSLPRRPGLATGGSRWAKLLDELLPELLDCPEGVEHLPQPQLQATEGLLHVGGQGGVQGPVERGQGPGQDRHDETVLSFGQKF